MRLTIRLSTAIALAATFISGCATPERSHREAVLSLPYEEFDQAYGDGWRVVFDGGDGTAAVALIEDYLDRHPELTVGQRKFLHLHAAQVLALDERKKQAVKHLDQAVSQQPLPELWPDWDDYIAATRAFLTHDQTALLAARERLAAAKAPRLKLADRFIHKFGQPYANVIWWVPVYSAVATPEGAPARLQSGAERLAKKLGCVVTVGETNSPRNCVWLQLRPFSPKVIPKGYVIAHSAEGTLITASDAQWLDDAVQRFMKSLVQNDGVWEAPFGLVSNFDQNPMANRRFHPPK